LKKSPPPEPKKPVYPNRSDKTDKTDWGFLFERKIKSFDGGCYAIEAFFVVY
jgi:hypothetical protein